jgi:hypothetical protein
MSLAHSGPPRARERPAPPVTQTDTLNTLTAQHPRLTTKTLQLSPGWTTGWLPSIYGASLHSAAATWAAASATELTLRLRLHRGWLTPLHIEGLPSAAIIGSL